MKTRFFGILALATTLTMGLTTGSAVACPVGVDEALIPSPRPVQNVSFQASELFERAQALESAASSREATAGAHDRDAETFATRARILRNQAGLVSPADRASLFALADELAVRAQIERGMASRLRAQAGDLRAQARLFRERAVQLVRFGNGGDGGWGRRPRPSAAVTAI